MEKASVTTECGQFDEKSGKIRGHPELNQGPLDLQSNALPLSYIPLIFALLYTRYE